MKAPVLLLVAALAACGSDDDEACVIEADPLPQGTHFTDPYAFELPGCVEGGLRELPGRWFIVDEEAVFQFEYPKFEGSCEAGFTRRGDFEVGPVDPVRPDDPDNRFDVWSDGTRFFRRYARVFVVDNQPFYYTYAFVTCMRADGTLAAVDAFFDTDRGERISKVKTGTRFARADELARGVTLLGELGVRGAPAERIIGYNVDVLDTMAYVVGASGFDIIDVANPAAPAHVAHYPGSYNDVRVVRGGGKTVVYLAPRDEETTVIVDVTTPATPTKVGDVPYAHSLQVTARGPTPLLYLANYTDRIPEYDITNPAAPVLLGAAPLFGGEMHGVHDLTPAGNILYANFTTGGTVALDISTGIDNARVIGQTPSAYSHASQAGVAGGRPVVLHGDEGMTKTPALGAHLRILDGDPAAVTYMRDIGKYQTRREVGIHNFQLVGDKVYIAYYQDGVRIVDLADPTAPRELAHYNTWDDETAFGSAFEGALGIRVVGDRIYVADSERGLLIFDED